MPKRFSDSEAIRILILPRNHYNVDAPASLAEEAKKLPLYKKHWSKTGGLFLRSEGELLLWIEEISKLKRKAEKS